MIPVLFLNHNLVGRGTYYRCLPFARQLVPAGFAPTILTAADQRQTGAVVREQEGVRIIQTPRWGAVGEHDGGWAPVDILYRLGYVLKHSFAIVHAFDHRPNVSLPWEVARLRGGVFVADWADWWCRGGILSSRRRWQFLDRWEAAVEEGTKRQAQAVTVTSRVLEQRALRLGIPPERITYLPSGADIEHIHPLERAACRARLGLPQEVPVVGYVGYSHWDLELLFSAFATVRETLPAAQLLVVGSKWKELRELGAAAGVHCVGAVPQLEIESYLGCADVLALPLRENPANQGRGPIKLGDYMAAGRPIVTQAVGDAGELVAREGIGVVAGQSATEFAGGLLTVLQNPVEADRQGCLARQLAEEKYSWKHAARPLVELYTKLLKGPGSEYRL